MATVRLRAPLKELAGGSADHTVEGTTVGELLLALEREHPAMSGWILDERGRIRQHVNVFVNGLHGREDTPLGPDDRVHVRPAITGGSVGEPMVPPRTPSSAAAQRTARSSPPGRQSRPPAATAYPQELSLAARHTPCPSGHGGSASTSSPSPCHEFSPPRRLIR
jgi:molybdopterin converting factor small subunit